MADHYHIRVKGYLDPLWSQWFDGLAVLHEADGDTVLDGPLVDQAALFGVLMKVRDLGLSLQGVDVQPADVAGDQPAEQRTLGRVDT
ncbi:MAG TPA: hypothetical protein VEZ12_08610 [Herpetosiphonaceae bacterium]|jgi:hypothetical protein|nr:hypothetical protein [Herpetosiphonaceae bacterium]